MHTLLTDGYLLTVLRGKQTFMPESLQGTADWQIPAAHAITIVCPQRPRSCLMSAAKGSTLASAIIGGSRAQWPQ